jgi:hypothetical protein
VQENEFMCREGLVCKAIPLKLVAVGLGVRLDKSSRPCCQRLSGQFL